MAEPRTRSEYRMPIGPNRAWSIVDGVTALSVDDRDDLAQLMLDAYRGTIDDEGESIDEAGQAIDEAISRCDPKHSFVLKESGIPIAMSLVLEFRGTTYIDPIAVAATHKQAGLGRRMVETSIASLVEAGITELGATITDGNEASERLFASLGAVRVGPWPPVAN